MEVRIPKTLLLFTCLAAVTLSGCAHGIVTQRSNISKNAIPAHRLPPELSARSRDNKVPLEFTRLRRPPVAEHIIGASDVLGIYIEDVLAVENQLPSVYYPTVALRENVQTPSVGHPVRVQRDGTVSLPLVGNVSVDELTLPQAVDKIRSVYLDKGILKESNFVTVDLISARSVKVFVIREDTGPGVGGLIRRDTQLYARRGTSTPLEMPVYENDVMHALSSTGGLPGIDGFNEVWILRGNTMDDTQRDDMLSQLQSGGDPSEYATPSQFVRIPLRVCRGQELPFAAEDVILHDGDVVFIESRDTEYFTTGGLITGGKYPLPRDHDVDVLEAIAIANTNINGPAGNATATNFRSGPGNIVAPTNAIVVRQLPNGEQIKIAVDLKAAMNDPNERIAVMPKDLIVLRYKPGELLANIALNFVNFNYAIPN